MSIGVIATSIFAIMHSNLTEVNMNEVTIVENGERNTITTEALTVLDLKTEGHFTTIGEFDEFSVVLEDEVYDGMEIEIVRAFPIILNDGGDRVEIMTVESDVSTVLNKHNIELGEDDLLEVVMSRTNSLGEEIQLNSRILGSFINTEFEVVITRVTFDSNTTSEEITFDTEYFYTAELPLGEREVRVEGSPKILETTIDTEYHNGVFYRTVNEETIIVDEGAQRVVAIGTYVPAPPPPPRNVNTTTPGEGASLDTFTASVTAYLPNCAGCSGITANGTDVRNNRTFYDSGFGVVRIVAADRRFPFGTIIYVSGVGNAIVLDRGSAVTGNILDLLMLEGQDPWQFGRQSLQAQVLRHGW